ESYPRADQVWVSSENEKALLARIVDSQRIHVVGNAIDLPDTPPSAPAIRSVAFLGWYRYPPNEAAALELMRSIMPVVHAAGGPERLVIIGPFATRAMVREASMTHDVTLTGQVADVGLELRTAGVLVVPIRSGGGTRVKILEAAAAGVPVVSTALGAEGLGMTPGVHFLSAETANQFAYQINQLTTDAGLREGLVRRAFQFVSDNSSLATVHAAVNAALDGLDVDPTSGSL
ncbi:MAG: glycosyltransferase family 4 protein, partial [Thermoanaerobaculia bacterium]